MDKNLIKDTMSRKTVDEEHMFTYGDDPEGGGRPPASSSSGLKLKPN